MKYYHSIAEWQADNFPHLIKEQRQRKTEKDPEKFGRAIADEIFQSIGIEALSVIFRIKEESNLVFT